jgi:acetolactate synthase small subunit
MAKLPYTWSKVSRGDIVSFIYVSKEGRRLRRTILVLEPKLKGLVHGIQLEVSNVPTNAEIKKILESAGDTEIVDADKKIYKVNLAGNSKKVYSKLKTLIKRHGIYRTYTYDKAKKSQVFLEDLKLPSQFIRELNEN